jgi:hypothetical protein
MIRQAHTYLVSAMSGVTLIAIAIVAFVLLVSAQVFRDWPIAALGESNSRPHISEARTASQPRATPTTTAAAGGSAKGSSAGSKASAKGTDQAKPSIAGGDLATSEGPTAPSGSEGGGPGDGGNQGGSNAPTSSPGSAPNSSNQSSSSSPGSSGGNSTSGTASTPSAKVTETVNNTVNQVDEAVTGGSLGKAGVTEVTAGVVNGVAGPESAVGKVVDETVKTVGGLLGGKP